MSTSLLVALVIKTSIAWLLVVAFRSLASRLGPAYQHWVGFCGMLAITLMALVIITGRSYRVEVSTPFSGFGAIQLHVSFDADSQATIEAPGDSPDGELSWVIDSQQAMDASHDADRISNIGVATNSNSSTNGNGRWTTRPMRRTASWTMGDFVLAVYLVIAGSMMFATVIVWTRAWSRVRRLPQLKHDDLVLALGKNWLANADIRLSPVHLSDMGQIPHVTGTVWPRLVLPSDWTSWSVIDLRCVVLHEWAHVRRRDVLTTRIMRLVVILFWWQPASHWLMRKLRDDREAACDDYVLRCNIKQSDYAACLTRMIRNLSSRRCPAAVIAVADHSSPVNRITRILEQRRFAPRMTVRRAASLSLALLSAGGVVGSTRLVLAEPPQLDMDSLMTVGETDEQIASEENQDQETAASSDENGDSFEITSVIIRGQVTDSTGTALSDVNLFVLSGKPAAPKQVGWTDGEGNFRFVVGPEAFQSMRTVLGTRSPDAVYLAAIKDGFAITHAKIEVDELRSAKADSATVARNLTVLNESAISLKIVDTLGQPVANAVARVVQPHDLSTGRWHKMVDAVAKQDPDRMTRREADILGWADVLPDAMANIHPIAQSTDNGDVELRGIAANQALEIEIAGPGIVPQRVGLIGSPGGETLAAKMREKFPPSKDMPTSNKGLKLYGEEASIPVLRTQTISGKVVDETTGEPLVGVRVSTSNDQLWSTTQTNVRGDYRLHAKRPTTTEAVTLKAFTFDKRYLGVRRTIEVPEVGDEANSNFSLRRGISMKGVVRRADNGEPIPATHRKDWHSAGPGPLVSGRAHYYPLAGTDFGGPPRTEDNQADPATVTFFYATAANVGRQTALIDGEGQFEIFVPPGPGVLLIDATPWKSMSSSQADRQRWPSLPRYRVVAQTVAGNDQVAATVRFQGLHGDIDAGGYHAFRGFDIPRESPPLEVEFDLEVIGTIGELPGPAARSNWDRHAEDSMYLWQSPSFQGFEGEGYFGDSEEAGDKLDRWTADGFPKLAMNKQHEVRQFLFTVRSGLLKMTKSKMPVLRHIGTSLIWNVKSPDARAVELMWRVADPEAKHEEHMKYNAVYFGLSVAKPTTPTLLEGLVRIAALTNDPETLDRIVWSLKDHRQESIKVYDRLPRPFQRQIKDVDVRRLILAGKLSAREWFSNKQLMKLQDKYGDKLPEIRGELVKLADEQLSFKFDKSEPSELTQEQYVEVAVRSRRRQQWIKRMKDESIYRLWNESFVDPLTMLADDPDPMTRREVIILSGLRWVWGRTNSPTAIVDMMLDASRDEHPEVKYNAVYYGLSVIDPRPPRVTRRMKEMVANQPNANYVQRLEWALSR